MNESFRVYNNSTILNRALDIFRLNVYFYVLFECAFIVKNNVTLSIVNFTRLYMIDDIMIIKLATA